MEQDIKTDHTGIEPFTTTTAPDLSNLRAAGPPSPKVVFINVKAGMPYLRQGKPANSFRALRKQVIDSAGFDFLATMADVMRHRNFQSDKVGVANRSRHKCGDAFDYDQSGRLFIVVHEPQGLQSYFRTWLRCTKQDGSQGVRVTLRDIRGHSVKGWYFDFTACAERNGWQRIPAWKGWGLKGTSYNKMEFWHYQCTEGLSFDEAMTFLYSTSDRTTVKDVRTPATIRVIGLNDRGSSVRNLQERLTKIKDRVGEAYLEREEVDGVFGKITQTAVKRLQADYGLDPDGLVGANTRNLIDSLS